MIKNTKKWKGSLAEYLGLKYEPIRDKVNNVNAVPYFAYYDVFKNFYANKQEDYFMIMGGSTITNGATIVTEDFIGDIVKAGVETLECKNPTTVTITGTDIKLEEIEKVKYLLDGNPIYLYVKSDTVRWEIVSKEPDKIVLRTKTGYHYRATRVLQGDTGAEITLKGTTEIIKQGTIIEKYTSSYKLEEIDNLREYILKQGKKEILIKADSKEEWLSTSFIKDVLVGTATETSEPKAKMPIIQMEMGGLCLP